MAIEDVIELRFKDYLPFSGFKSYSQRVACVTDKTYFPQINTNIEHLNDVGGIYFLITIGSIFYGLSFFPLK